MVKIIAGLRHYPRWTHDAFWNQCNFFKDIPCFRNQSSTFWNGDRTRDVFCTPFKTDMGFYHLKSFAVLDDICSVTSRMPFRNESCSQTCSCLTCIPGSYKSKDCTASSQGICTDCPSETFNINVTI